MATTIAPSNENTAIKSLDSHLSNLTISPSCSSPTNNSNSNDEPVLGFTQNLIAKLQQSRLLLDAYVKEQRELSDAAVRRQNQVSKFERDEICQKMEELKSVQRQRGLMIGDDGDGDGDNSSNQAGNKGGLIRQQQNLKEEQIKIERELASCHLEQKRVEKNVKVVREIEERAFAKAEEIRNAKEKVANSKRVTVDDLTLAVFKYEALGVNFVKGEDMRVRFDFTQIDPSDPKRVFSFYLDIVTIDGNDQYEVVDCVPQINAGTVVSLVDELNLTSAWSTFIVGMRKAFKETL
mmetsp:Transcript_23788/g.27515  ORF Transcript_23788/g.27515 Transcript_23788/m.27515 type:complete len:293 (-) Transcript_23788:59-937(-)